MTADPAFDTPQYDATSAAIAAALKPDPAAIKPARCPGYECVPGRTWTEAHRDDPDPEPGFPPGHFWYAAPDHTESYMAHGDDAVKIAAARADGIAELDEHGVSLHDLAAAAVARSEILRAETMPDLPPPPADLGTDAVILGWYQAIGALDTQIAEIEDELAPLREQRDRAVLHVQEAMGDAEIGLVAGRVVVTWKWSKPRRVIDQAALEAAFGKDVVARRFMKDARAARPFRLAGKGGSR